MISMMMSDIVRRPSDQCSPKTSPRGNRSPVVPRQDSTGTLKTTISLGKTPAIVHSGPFYLMKELPPQSELTGSTNLIQYHNLEHSFNKFCGRKIKNDLSAFLPNLPGNIDVPASSGEDSSLRELIKKPPITSIEITPLTKQHFDSAFRLHVGPIPEQYRFMSQTIQRKNKHKHKKSKQKSSSDTPLHDTHNDPNIELLSSREHEKKHKKQKRHDEDKERRKKKKDKKKKKQRHSPEPSNSHMSGVMSGGDGPIGSVGSVGAGSASPMPSNNSLIGALMGSNGLGRGIGGSGGGGGGGGPLGSAGSNSSTANSNATNGMNGSLGGRPM